MVIMTDEQLIVAIDESNFDTLERTIADDDMCGAYPHGYDAGIIEAALDGTATNLPLIEKIIDESDSAAPTR